MESPYAIITQGGELLAKAYQQELEELQRQLRELIKKHPELARQEEIDVPEFLRKHESLKVIRARISRSTTAFSKFVRLS